MPSQMRHHPNTSRESVSFPHHHTHTHGIRFTPQELASVFRRIEFAPNQAISRFGLQNATQVLSYLGSAEGKLVKSTIIDEIEIMLSKIEENQFEDAEALAQHRRTLVFLMMRYIHARAQANQNASQREQFFDDAIKEDSSLPKPELKVDIEFSYKKIEDEYARQIKLEKELQLDFEEQMKNLKDFEKQLEDLLQVHENEETKTLAESFAEAFMAISLEFSDELESELEQTKKQVDELEKKPGAPKPKGPQPSGSNVNELHRLKAKMAMQSDILAKLHQSIMQISANQQAHSPEQRPTLQQEASQLVQNMQQHRKALETQHTPSVTNLGRLAAERNQLSNQERLVMKHYIEAQQRVQNNAAPAPSVSRGFELPKPRPR